MRIISDTHIREHLMEYDAVFFPMSTVNSLNRGLPYEIGLSFPEVKASEKATPYGDRNKYGTVHCTVVDGKVFGACYVHNGGFRKTDDGSFIDYEALRGALEVIRDNFRGKRICMPLMGGNDYDGNGDRETLLAIHEETLGGTDCDVYDYKHEEYRVILYRELVTAANRMKRGEITRGDYEAIKKDIDRRKKQGEINRYGKD